MIRVVSAPSPVAISLMFFFIIVYFIMLVIILINSLPEHIAAPVKIIVPAVAKARLNTFFISLLFVIVSALPK